MRKAFIVETNKRCYNKKGCSNLHPFFILFIEVKYPVHQLPFFS